MFTIQIELATEQRHRRNTMIRDGEYLTSHSELLSTLVKEVREITDEPVLIIGKDGETLGWLCDLSTE